jgi:hypothetical protein
MADGRQGSLPASGIGRTATGGTPADRDLSHSLQEEHEQHTLLMRKITIIYLLPRWSRRFTVYY